VTASEIHALAIGFADLLEAVKDHPAASDLVEEGIRKFHEETLKPAMQFLQSADRAESPA
jgi:hypothetical protein